MMSPSAVRILTLLYCTVIPLAYCNGNNITAYVNEYLTTITCVSVPQIRSVCNIDWKIRQADAEIYNSVINSINSTISSRDLYRGLSEGDAMHCRKMYENMMCRNTFPVCDTKRMVIDYGDGKARCNFAREACTTISIEGCEYSLKGEEPIISELNKCENISTNTTKLCPGIQVKVPSRYNLQIVKPIVDSLSKIAEMFSDELRNRTVPAGCEAKYREVLCRLIDACSPDGFYYLHYISSSECEEMTSCLWSRVYESMQDTEACKRRGSIQTKRKFFPTVVGYKSKHSNILRHFSAPNSSSSRRLFSPAKGIKKNFKVLKECQAKF